MAISDIIVTPCKIYYSNLGTTLPADSVSYGGAWPAGWTALGLTNTPLSMDYTREPVMAEIQESLSDIIRGYKKEALVIETALAELTLANLQLSWGGEYTATPAGAGQVAKEELVGGDDVFPFERQWGFEGLFVSDSGTGFPIRFFIWRGVAEFGGKLEFGKSDAVSTPLRITCNPDTTKTLGQRLFKWQKVTAAAAS
jgi:hypothetical protein